MRHYSTLCLLAFLSSNVCACSSESPTNPAGATAGVSGSTAASAGAATGGSGGASFAGTGGSPAGGAGGGLGNGGVSGGAGAAGIAGTGVGGTSSGGTGGAPATNPLIDLLPLFSAPNVPQRGPKEAPANPRNYNGTVPERPGDGLAQHPMLYVGENYNRISLVNQGKVVWTYDTNGGFELDDIWMLSNGNILYSHMSYIEEVTPEKEVVWHYEPPSGEIHTCQPIGLDKVLIGLNQNPAPKLQLINIKTNEIEVEHVMEEGAGADVHSQMRRMRYTAAGTYLVGLMAKGKVVEYDKDFKPIWTFNTARPWSVARLHNGNTLIQDETESTCKEVDPTGTVVWSLKKSELSVAGAMVSGNTQTCERLANGNTVMLLHSSPGSLQAVEVTRSKEVVWALEDWKNLGDATSAQFLDQPGIPELPGATEH